MGRVQFAAVCLLLRPAVGYQLARLSAHAATSPWRRGEHACSALSEAVVAGSPLVPAPLASLPRHSASPIVMQNEMEPEEGWNVDNLMDMMGAADDAIE